MKLQLPDIAGVARMVGFAGDAVPVAVAVAAGTSGGLTHYDHPVGIPGAGRYVGLWGVDTDRHDRYDPDRLHDPLEAAQAAYDLTSEAGDWGWSACYRSGHYVAFMRHALVAHTKLPGTAKPEPAWTIDEAAHTIGGALAGMHAMQHDRLDAPSRMGHRWQIPTK